MSQNAMRNSSPRQAISAVWTGELQISRAAAETGNCQQSYVPPQRSIGTDLWKTTAVADRSEWDCAIGLRSMIVAGLSPDCARAEFIEVRLEVRYYELCLHRCTFELH